MRNMRGTLLENIQNIYLTGDLDILLRSRDRRSRRLFS